MSAAHEAALRMIRAGRWAEAELACDRLVAQFPQDPRALQMLGIAKRHTGKLPEAEALMRRAVERMPNDAELRTNLGQLLLARDRLEEGTRELERAVALAPGFRPARLALARLAARTSRHVLAEQHARALIAADARDAEAWSALGAALHGMGRSVEAHTAFRRAVDLAPDYGHARYQLATTLCEQERAEEALQEAGKATRAGVAHRGLTLTRARALMHLDRYDAAEALLAELVDAAPEDIEAQFLLAQLRHVKGDADFARALGEVASRAQTSVAVRAAYADVMRRAGQTGFAEELVRALIRECGPRPELLSSLGALLLESGRPPEALAAAEDAAHALPDDAAVAENFVAAALAAGAGDAALPIIERFRARAPRDQRWITYRADVARQRGEALFDDWCDLERLVQVYDLPAPAGYASIDAFHAALAPVLESRHRQNRHPLDQSLRAGTQTSRGLLADDDPVIATFLASLAEPLAAFQGLAGRGAGHPFIERNASPAKLVGCWSVRLRRGGYHVNHIHPEGWISSAYYVALPTEIDDIAARSGWIKFGEPRFPMPGCEAGRFVQPRPGRLVLFPSYLWHGTTPITGDEPRLAIAFDAVPQSERT